MPSSSKSKHTSRSATKKNFIHEFREYATTHGSDLKTHRRAAEIQNMIDAARERIKKARSVSTKSGGGRRGTTRKMGLPSNVHFVGVIQREIIIPIGKKHTRRRKH
jgi:hypothetical protein